MYDDDVLCRLYEAKDERHAQAFINKVSLKAERSRPLEERVDSGGYKPKGRRDSFFEEEETVRGHGGSRQLSFVPRGGSGGSRGRGGRAGGRGGYGGRDGGRFGGAGDRDFKKRGVQSLGLKSDNGYGGRGGRGGGRGFRGRGRGRGRS